MLTALHPLTTTSKLRDSGLEMGSSHYRWGALYVLLFVACAMAQTTAPQCTSSSQCDDKNACTNNNCLRGKCVFTAKPGCCLNDAACEDYNPCTLDSCVYNATCRYNECQHVRNPACDTTSTTTSTSTTTTTTTTSTRPPTTSTTTTTPQCVKSSQCEDNDPCTDNRCVNKRCFFTKKDGCCRNNEACNDYNDCTIDSCIYNATCLYNKCSYARNPACDTTTTIKTTT